MSFEDKYLCGALYFSKSKIDDCVSSFWKLALKYANELGLEITHFDFSRYDGKDSKRVYRYIKRNEKHLLGNDLWNELRSLYFYSTEGEVNFFAPTFQLCVRDVEDCDYNVLFMQCQLSQMRNIDSMKFLEQFINDAGSCFQLDYGLITLQKGNMYPMPYFTANLDTSPYRSPEDKYNLKIWEKEGSHFKTAVRDIYWGNILSKDHWGNNAAKKEYLITELKYECEGNVFCIGDSALFFCTSFDILGCEKQEESMGIFKKRIRKILENTDIEVLGVN